MKRMNLFVAFFSMGLLTACGAPPGAPPESGPDLTEGAEAASSTAAAGKQQTESRQGEALNRPDAGETGFEGPDGFGNETGHQGDDFIEEPEHRVYFNFDSALLPDESRRVLMENLAWLERVTWSELIIEGHCDERGTREYNLALGQSRADVVKQFLVSQGVDSTRIRTISYGKERPLVSGHDEFAWSKNRRSELVLR